MFHKIHHMEPLLPAGANDLTDMARDVVGRSAAPGGQLHPVSQRPLIELLRLINSYYSNLIAGRSTHPVDIERAMRHVYFDDPVKRDLQQESLAHINCQRIIEERINSEPDLNVASPPGRSAACPLH